MGAIHIHWNRDTARPWWPTEQRVFGTAAKTKRKVFTDCCACWMHAHRTICQLRRQEIPVGGPGDYQEKPLGDWDTPGFSYSYYDPEWRIECDPESGCKINPRKVNGADLRRWMHYG